MSNEVCATPPPPHTHTPKHTHTHTGKELKQCGGCMRQPHIWSLLPRPLPPLDGWVETRSTTGTRGSGSSGGKSPNCFTGAKCYLTSLPPSLPPSLPLPSSLPPFLPPPSSAGRLSTSPIFWYLSLSCTRWPSSARRERSKVTSPSPSDIWQVCTHMLLINSTFRVCRVYYYMCVVVSVQMRNWTIKANTKPPSSSSLTLRLR